MNFSQIPSSNCYYLAVWNGSQHLFDTVVFPRQISQKSQPPTTQTHQVSFYGRFVWTLWCSVLKQWGPTSRTTKPTRKESPREASPNPEASSSGPQALSPSVAIDTFPETPVTAMWGFKLRLLNRNGYGNFSQEKCRSSRWDGWKME